MINLVVFSVVGIAALLLLASCSTSSTSTQSSGTGFLWLAAQGNTTVSAYTINLGSGAISANGNAAGTGPAPAALIVAPNGSAIFVANSGSDPGTISSYTVNSNGTLAAASQVTENRPALAPMGLAIDSAGRFLFVANQGSFDLSEPGSISVFSVNGTTLTEIAGSPFLDESVSATQGSGPVALAVNPAGGTLYAANQFNGTVSEFSIDQNSGTLTLLSALGQGVGSSPSGLLAVKTSSASFLYVANTGSNDVTAFTLNSDGSLTGIETFPAGTGPVAVATDSGGNYLFVADKNSNQVSQYKISSTTGFLTANSPAAISTGATPVALAVRSGTSGITSTRGTTEFLYVVNMASGSISIFSFDSTTGLLGQVGSPVSTFGQPSAIAVR